MNMKAHPRMTTPGHVLRNGALLALWLSGATVLAQSVTIQQILAPGAPLSITSLNSTGQVTGYYFDSESAQRAFVWGDGAATALASLGGTASVGNALNNAGVVVGYSMVAGDTEFHAFAASGAGTSDLGTLGGVYSVATAINDSGWIAGHSTATPEGFSFRAFLISGGPMLDIGTLGGSSSTVRRMNNAGQIAGNSSIEGDAGVHAFLYSGGAMRDIGTLGGFSSFALALNASGQVAGESTTVEELTRAFFFNGQATLDLGTLGGTYSTAVALNDAGEVVGDSLTAGDAELHGFIYRNAGMQDLGTLGGSSSSAAGINNRSQVVGTASDAAGRQRAFIWENGVMTDLNTLLPSNSGWELTSARFINDNRQIVGEGVFEGTVGWYLLTLPASGENHAPVASAGPDQSLTCGRVARLDGSASSDPDRDELSYEWFNGGVSLGATAVLEVELPLGTHTFTLRVTDPHGASAEDSVVVAVEVDALAPVVQCPPGQTAPANARGRAAVPDFLATLVASDNCTGAEALVKKQSPPAGTMLKAGAHTVTLSVSDSSGNRTVCSVIFTVADVTSPSVRCPEDIYRRARTNCQAVVPDLSGRLNASDNVTPSGQLVITQQPAAGTLVGTGTHEIHLTVTDAAGNSTACVVKLHVLDLAAPVVRSLTASPNVLQPVDGRMVPVTLSVVATDNCDPQPLARIVAVASSEPATGLNDTTPVDWEITGNLTLNLRAEVASRRSPRIYFILVAVSDDSGNTTYRAVYVRVPRNTQ